MSQPSQSRFASDSISIKTPDTDYDIHPICMNCLKELGGQPAPSMNNPGGIYMRIEALVDLRVYGNVSRPGINPGAGMPQY